MEENIEDNLYHSPKKLSHSPKKLSPNALGSNLNKAYQKSKKKGFRMESALKLKSSLKKHAKKSTDPTAYELLKVADKYCSCASVLTGNERLNIKNKKEEVKVNAWFCKTRLCPTCERNMAKKNTPKLLALLKALEGENLILLTLTVPNVHYTELRHTVERMNTAFSKLREKQYQKKKLRKIIKGYYRKLEVTIENKRPDYLHPHFHCLLHLNKSYFKGNNYIKRDLWLHFWQECYGDNTITQVDVRRIKADKKVAKEIAKYTSKPPKNPKPETLANFVDAMVLTMKRRRFIFKGGTIRELMKQISKEQDAAEGSEDWENLSEFFAVFNRKDMRYEVKKYRLF